LPQLVQHGSLEFSQLIEKKYASVGQAEFTRSGVVSATEEGGS
tara:strand:+ start:891 stop:1019 length:129 start_codon:yes stop_codon:yes gene_type:complete